VTQVLRKGKDDSNTATVEKALNMGIQIVDENWLQKVLEGHEPRASQSQKSKKKKGKVHLLIYEILLEISTWYICSGDSIGDSVATL
jgi:hypothetical protein